MSDDCTVMFKYLSHNVTIRGEKDQYFAYSIPWYHIVSYCFLIGQI